MTSRNWPNEFARACATISLLLCWPLAAQTKAPADRAARCRRRRAMAELDARGGLAGDHSLQARRGGHRFPRAGAGRARWRPRSRTDRWTRRGSTSPGAAMPAAAVFYAISRVPGFVGRGRGARRFAQGGDRHQSHFRGEFHQRAGAVDLRRRKQAAGGEIDCRQTQPGVAAGVGRRQRGVAHPMAGEAQARRVPALDRLRDQLARVCALLLDPADEVRRQRAQ